MVSSTPKRGFGRLDAWFRPTSMRGFVQVALREIFWPQHTLKMLKKGPWGEGGGLGNTNPPFMTTSDLFDENFNTCRAGGMYKTNPSMIVHSPATVPPC